MAYLLDTKEAIRSAIIAAGVNVPANAQLGQYYTYIDKITVTRNSSNSND